jgi:tRNA 2-selenouridine synthase
MRSRSLFTVMDMIGYKSFLLDKGYKSYRQTVNHFFYSARLPKIINLYGPSGTGKTELLAIFKKNNIPIINLENLANHKGSILGGFEADQPSQKYFESLLFEEIRKFQDAKFIVLEGESRKIGKLSLPKILYDSMISGENVWVEIPRNIRAVRLAEEYKDNSNLIIERLNYIKKTLGGESYEEVSNLIFSNKRVEAAEILLQKYYDVFYLKSSPEKGNRKYCKIFKENSFEELADSVLSFFQEKR